MNFNKLLLSFLFCIITSFLFGQTTTDAKSVQPLGVGNTIPNSTLTSITHEKIKLHDVILGKNSVIIFYRGGWCPYCNLHLAELAQSEEEIRQQGFQIIGISPDDIANLQPTMDKDEIGYALYSDPKSSLIHKMKLAFKPGWLTKCFLKSRTKGKATDTLPVPAVYITDKDGNIQYVHFDPNYKERLSAEELLKVIKKLKND